MASSGESVAASSRRLVNNKRRMTRAAVLPDVTNLPEVHPDMKVSRRQTMVHKSSYQPPVSNCQGKTNSQKCFLAPFSGGHGIKNSIVTCENQGLPVRAAKIAAKAKLKATITPFVRKKRQPFKVSYASESDTSIPYDEPMEIDNQALFTDVFEERVPKRIVDIDNHDDYFLCPQYAQDIFYYLKTRENLVLLPQDHLSINPDVTSQMRGILVDWLIQVQTHEQLEEETLQLCVIITDQFLSRATVPLANLQLVGITALLIAAKYVERFPPTVGTLCALTAGTYSEMDVLDLEKRVLIALQFDLSFPIPLFFLQRFLMVHQDDVQVERLARYLVDLSLPSIYLVSVPPSMLAASALYVARSVWLPEEPDAWSPGLVFYSGYRSEHFADTVRLQAKMLLRAGVSKYQAARQKHSEERCYGAISADPVLEDHPALVELARGD
ncbi:G2/mitotic-specific cyclin-B-like [Littorina saxatilis]|uniref:Uncharacterized protein n=1 Tax=Littorina saxatilis TaxID=31220 RepID=A0AAN9GFM2_9CAEN